MMPEECPSMRSMARWVLPVLVGPSTAVTPAPRARASRLLGAEKEIDIIDPKGTPLGFLYVFVCTTMRRCKGLCLSCGTSLERIAPESLTPPLSEFVHCKMSPHLVHEPPNQVYAPSSYLWLVPSFVNASGRR